MYMKIKERKKDEVLLWGAVTNHHIGWEFIVSMAVPHMDIV